ncbi:hypothetical protein PCYB_004260 [Plasmodium cynomolgi strain B]|uniref:CYIR protein n=1 Tax=Plasmodium cynomolgi (strain B) TaxID=1120755 RepID=K6VJS9_PLACD|nr:hypothetical protein PCYB_004260 [Plasmodium cynomolgi strain B]GAB69677.1 hypothetical protein PCYB_004260 [Plasmodium cynomolgi strain B]
MEKLEIIIIIYKIQSIKFNMDFVREYILCDTGVRDDAIVCSSKIKFLDRDVYHRMRYLYDLYDKYNGLKESREYVDDNTCDKLRNFVSIFNYMAIDHGTNDRELLNRLTDLRKLIDMNILLSNNTCNPKINFFNLPEPSTKAQKNQDQAHFQRNGQQETSSKSPKISLRTQETVPILTKVSEVPKVVTSSRGSEKVTNLKESHHTEESVFLKPLGSEWETINYNPRSSHGQGRSHVQRPEESYPMMEKEKGHTEGRMYPSNSTSEEGGKSGILGSISGALGEVDPVPVVGVSGGIKNLKLYLCSQ